MAVNAYYAQFEPGAEAGGAESAAEAVLAPAEEPETEETASVTVGNSAEEKKEFDTIENSEGVG